MRELKKHMGIFGRCLLRSRFFYLYIIIIYFVFGSFDKFSRPFMKSYEDYIFRYNGQQYYIILTIVFFLALFMKEEFFSGYESIILPHVKREKSYFGALFVTVYLYNLIPFLTISLAVFVVNGLRSGYYPAGLFCVNLLLVAMEMASTLLLGIGFFEHVKVFL